MRRVVKGSLASLYSCCYRGVSAIHTKLSAGNISDYQESGACVQRIQVLECSLRPSRHLALLMIAVHALAVAVVWRLELPIELHIALKFAIAVSLAYALLHDGWFKFSKAPVVLRVLPAANSTDADSIELTFRDGRTARGKIVSGSFVAPYLTVLRFQADNASRFRPAKSLVVLPDSLDTESFRQLRVQLKWGATTAV